MTSTAASSRPARTRTPAMKAAAPEPKKARAKPSAAASAKHKVAAKPKVSTKAKVSAKPKGKASAKSKTSAKSTKKSSATSTKSAKSGASSTKSTTTRSRAASSKKSQRGGGGGAAGSGRPSYLKMVCAALEKLQQGRKAVSRIAIGNYMLENEFGGQAPPTGFKSSLARALKSGVEMGALVRPAQSPQSFRLAPVAQRVRALGGRKRTAAKKTVAARGTKSRPGSAASSARGGGKKKPKAPARQRLSTKKWMLEHLHAHGEMTREALATGIAAEHKVETPTLLKSMKPALARGIKDGLFVVNDAGVIRLSPAGMAAAVKPAAPSAASAAAVPVPDLASAPAAGPAPTPTPAPAPAAASGGAPDSGPAPMATSA